MKKSVFIRRVTLNKKRILFGVLGFLLALSFGVPLATGTTIYESSLQEVGRISIPGEGRMFIHADGNHVYVARYGNPTTFSVVNVSDKSAPCIEGQIDNLPNFSNVHDLWYSNGYAYTAHRWGGVSMINVSDSTAPYVQSTANTNYTHRGIMSVGDYLYVAEHSVGSSLGGMRIFDVSGGSPNQVGSFFAQIDGRDLAISSDGQHAYQSTSEDDWGPHALYTFDVSDKSNPTELSSIPNIYGGELLISPDDRYLYMTYVMEPDHWDSPSKGIKIYDLADPAQPSEIATIPLLNAEDIALDHRRKLLYVRLYAGDPGIYVFNVHNPSHPTQVCYYPLDSTQNGDLFYDGNHVYAVEGANDLVILKSVSPNNSAIAYDPHNNRHLLVYDAEGDIYAQLINYDGTTFGPEVLLTETCSDSNQRNPSVAYDTENQVFLVAWEIHVDSASIIWGRTVDADGSPVGNYGFLISFETHSRGNPSVACDSVNNMFIVVWNDSRNLDDSYNDIYGQIVNPQGILYGDNIVISDAAHGQSMPLVIYAGGNFLVAWNDYRNWNITGYDIYGQYLNPNGSPLNYEFVICDDDKDQLVHSAAYNSMNRRSLVVWSDGRGGETTMVDIYGQMVSWRNLIGDQIVISDAEKFQYDPSVAYNYANNSFLVVWSDMRNRGQTGYGELGNIDIYGQVVNGNGILSSGNFVISGAPDAQTSPSIACNSNCASFLVAFNTLETGVPEIGFAVPGDLDCDCDVDYDDYLIFRTAYGSCRGDDNFLPAADLDGDGCVTINDYRIFRTLI